MVNGAAQPVAHSSQTLSARGPPRHYGPSCDHDNGSKSRAKRSSWSPAKSGAPSAHPAAWGNSEGATWTPYYDLTPGRMTNASCGGCREAHTPRGIAAGDPSWGMWSLGACHPTTVLGGLGQPLTDDHQGVSDVAIVLRRHREDLRLV